ncbi:MAG: hypothetical protein DMG07_02550 [Acidobacteria bacterium]|nr:MAG: hypothetical protein DMG07_02550 [Acidobacteriota bacterium]
MTDSKEIRGWVLYDGDCVLCIGLARRFAPLLRRRGFVPAPLPSGTQIDEMVVLTGQGQAWGGADGVVYLARWVWWAWPLAAAGRIPFVLHGLRRAYRWLAARRHCLGGVCERRNRARVPWLPAAVLPLVALALRSSLPAWAFMWAIGFALLAGFKWLTWCDARDWESPRKRPGRLRSIGYFLGWVGLDARRFLDESAGPPRPAAGAWAWAVFNSLSGAALLWRVARSASAQPRLSGWIGLAGMGLLLHFGFFNLLALAWQRAGVNAAQIMNAPVLATSVAEFWGRRWNMAFRDLAHRFVFRPLCPRAGIAAATFAVFLVSGLLHELVISLPAGGGYGLPAAYFVFQWVALGVERSRVGKELGLGGGWRGWLFTMTATAGPAFYLFHPPFIRLVVVPFLQALGAL